MGFNPVNLTFRFLLEIVGLIGVFRLGLVLGTGVWQWVLAFAFTLAAMVLWATFRVPGDASAKGDAPYSVSGTVRLVIELLVFGGGALGWFVAGPLWMAWTYLAALVLHHDVEYGGMHWITVGPADQPGTSIVLYPPEAAPGLTDDERQAIVEMMAKGTYASINLATSDLDGTFDRLQAGDAEVVQEPTDQPYGIRDCAFRDPAGNMIRIQERR